MIWFLSHVKKMSSDPVEGLITSDGIAWIESLPEEVLEYIFKLISPYGDFTACSRYVGGGWKSNGLFTKYEGELYNNYFLLEKTWRNISNQNIEP